MDDPQQKIRWGDDHWARLDGGRAVVDEGEDDVIYLAASLRNVGQGIAVIQGWRVEPDATMRPMPRPDVESFRPQGRDLYVPAGDVSFWQAGLRDPNDPDRPEVLAAIHNRQVLLVDLLYGDHEGGQRTISRFSFSPIGDENAWLASVIRHWNLDRADPR
jgi:hypothetical protein